MANALIQTAQIEGQKAALVRAADSVVDGDVYRDGEFYWVKQGPDEWTIGRVTIGADGGVYFFLPGDKVEEEYCELFTVGPRILPPEPLPGSCPQCGE